MRLPVLLLALLLALGAVITPSSLTADADPPMIEAVQPLQWVALNPWSGQNELGNHCTVGFINKRENYWLTAAHCVAGAADNTDTGVSIDVTEAPLFINGVTAQVVYADFVDDLAILQTEGYNAKPLKLARFAPWWLGEIQMAGYPLGVGPFLVKGFIANPAWTWNGNTYTLYNLAGCGGNSGSPVLNLDNEVIGVLQVGFGNASCSDLMGGAPLSHLKRLKAYFGK